MQLSTVEMIQCNKYIKDEHSVTLMMYKNEHF